MRHEPAITLIVGLVYILVTIYISSPNNSLGVISQSDVSLSTHTFVTGSDDKLHIWNIQKQKNLFEIRVDESQNVLDGHLLFVIPKKNVLLTIYYQTLDQDLVYKMSTLTVGSSLTLETYNIPGTTTIQKAVFNSNTKKILFKRKHDQHLFRLLSLDGDLITGPLQSILDGRILAFTQLYSPNGRECVLAIQYTPDTHLFRISVVSKSNQSWRINVLFAEEITGVDGEYILEDYEDYLYFLQKPVLGVSDDLMRVVFIFQQRLYTLEVVPDFKNIGDGTVTLKSENVPEMYERDFNVESIYLYREGKIDYLVLNTHRKLFLLSSSPRLKPDTNRIGELIYWWFTSPMVLLDMMFSGITAADQYLQGESFDEILFPPANHSFNLIGQWTARHKIISLTNINHQLYVLEDDGTLNHLDAKNIEPINGIRDFVKQSWVLLIAQSIIVFVFVIWEFFGAQGSLFGWVYLLLLVWSLISIYVEDSML